MWYDKWLFSALPIFFSSLITKPQVSNSYFRMQHRPSLSLVMKMALICSRHWNWTLFFSANTRGERPEWVSSLCFYWDFMMMQNGSYSCGYRHVYVNSVHLEREPFAPLEQNDKAFTGLKGWGVSLPRHDLNKVPLENVTSQCQWIKSVSQVLKRCHRYYLWLTCCTLLRDVTFYLHNLKQKSEAGDK